MKDNASIYYLKPQFSFWNSIYPVLMQDWLISRSLGEFSTDLLPKLQNLKGNGGIMDAYDFQQSSSLANTESLMCSGIMLVVAVLHHN